jgi:hypothetical protein
MQDMQLVHVLQANCTFFSMPHSVAILLVFNQSACICCFIAMCCVYMWEEIVKVQAYVLVVCCAHVLLQSKWAAVFTLTMLGQPTILFTSL